MTLFKTPQELAQERAQAQRTLQLTPAQEHELLRSSCLLPRLSAQDLARSKNLYHHITHPSTHLKAYLCQYDLRTFYYGTLHHIHTEEARNNYATPGIWWHANVSGIPQLVIGLRGAPAGANITIYPIPVMCPATHRLTGIAYRCYNWRISAAFPDIAHRHSTGKSPLLALRRYTEACLKAHAAADKTPLDKLIML